ncbi:MAG: Polymorphic outer membrane protein [Microgenomates group bacterium GW2011_GWA2_47_8]|nr:MAG: Polymorphic outer membrane protein [Microgenomates group bacterium GW2011_GWA2_47_8]
MVGQPNFSFLSLLATLFFFFVLVSTKNQIFANEYFVAPNDSEGLIIAINEANNNSEIDTINLASESIYNLIDPVDNPIFDQEYGSNGLPVINSDNEIIINGNHSKINREESAQRFRIFAIQFPGKLTLNKIVINGGFSISSNTGGGAILNLSGTLILNNSVISKNTALIGGGAGIWALGGTSNISNSSISDNNSGNNGETISSGGAFVKRGLGLFQVSDSIIENNVAETIGGAIYSNATSSGEINISNSRILNNSTRLQGGAIYNYQGKINIINSCISGNLPNAVVNETTSLFIINATQNWWGNLLGPNQPGADTVSGDVDYSSPLSSCPPLSSPSPTPTPTPSPSPSPNTPIVFLPGLGGSWNTADLISGNSGGVWKKTPFIDLLNNYINTKFGAGTKINLVGHSLGGLVSRTYAQRYGESKINQIVTAGSPHQGAIPAYLAWSGAQLKEGDNWESLGLGLYLHLHQGRFNSPVTAIQTLSPSLKDLLPIFDFTKNLSGEIIPVNSLQTTNNFLNDLKTDLTPTLTDIMTTIAGNQQTTIEWVKLGDQSLADRLLNRWADGRPSSYNYTNDGDATVLGESALINAADQTEIANSHQDLVQTSAGIEAILSALNITATPQTGSEQPPRTPGLFFLLHSPAEITVTAPDGSQAGFNVASPMPNVFYSPDDKLLLIFNALTGNYQTEITGTGNGEYQLDIGQLTDNGEIWSSLMDEITLGNTDDWTVNFNPQQPLEDPIIDNDGQDKINQAKLRLEQLKPQTKPKLRVYLNQITRLLNKNQIPSLRLALTSTCQNSHSLTKKQVKAELNTALKVKQQLETKAGQISGTNEVLGNTLDLINRYSDRAQTGFNQNNFWQTHADALVTRVLAMEGNALIK